MFDLKKEDIVIPSDGALFWKIYKSNFLDLVGLYLLMLLMILFFVLPYIISADPLTQNSEIRLLPPSWVDGGQLKHFLGTDEFGRDFLSRLLIGGQNTFWYSFLSAFFAMIIGVVLGLTSGLSKNLTWKNILHHIFDIVLSVPSVMIVIIFSAILGPTLIHTTIAIAVSLIPRFIHTTYLAVKRELEKDYIASAMLDGSSYFQLTRLTIFPNIVSTIVTHFFEALSVAIIDISAMGFIGMGAKPPKPELGSIISSGIELMNVDSSQVILTGMSIILFILSLNMVAHGIIRVLEAGAKHVSA